MKSREERLDRYMKVMELLPQAKAELMRYPGVSDVTVGAKETGREVTEEVAFRVHVREKKPTSALPADAVIPSEVLGVPTDVVREPRPRNRSDGAKYRPLQGGIKIGNDTAPSSGTLGCIAQLNTDRSIVLLSNRHVMLDGRELAVTSTEKIGQPSISCCCCCKGNIVGNVVNAAYDDLIDCAIATVVGQPGFTNEIQDVGLVFGSAPLNVGSSTVVNQERVWKRGAKSGLTSGKVVAPLMNTPANPDDGVPARSQQIQILGDPATPDFSVAGDSGSVIVDENNVVVGLLWGGDDTYTYACLITTVVSRMNITIINSGTAGTIPLGSAPDGDALARADAPLGALPAIEAALAQSEGGRELKALFDRHSHEINHLLDANRHVKVAWHRYQGPAFLGHVIKSAQESDYRIPNAIADVSLANLLIRMSVELQEHGSVALALAIERHTSPLLNLLADATSVHDLLQRLDEATAVGSA